MKHLLCLIGLSTAITFSSCGGKEHEDTISTGITAARIEGRRAARIIVVREWKDSTELQHQLLEVKSRQSKYLIEGKAECAAAFDSAFISTIRAVKPDLARSIGSK